MYLAYFDESGDSGHPGLVNSPTNFFVVSAIVIRHDKWLTVLNKLIELRRDLRTRLGIPTRPEIKSQHIRSGGGVFLRLAMTHEQRIELYRELMRFQETSLPEATCFCVAINKRKILKQRMDIR